jgi:GNAT superfamily N-acetyltransferase
LNSDFKFRRATPDDAATVALHRRLMFEELGHHDSVKLDAMTAQFQTWVKDKLAREEYLGWFMTEADQTVAGVGLWIREAMLTPNNLSGRQGYVGTVYTHPDYRRRGYAKMLMETLLDWCHEHDINGVLLHPSEQAVALYQSLGFEAIDTMFLSLRDYIPQD